MKGEDRSMGRLTLVLCALALWLAAAPAAIAEMGDLLASYGGINVVGFALDAERGLLYASVQNTNSVVVIDTASLELLDEVVVGARPNRLALSADGTRLYVALVHSSFIAVVDTATMTVVDQFAIPRDAYDVEVGLDGRLYATPGYDTGYDGIMMVDTNTGQYLGDFELGVFVYYSGLLEISADRETLYFANRGLSPGTLAKYDVSDATPILLYMNPHGSLGSNGQDLALSHAGDAVYYACGSGNGGYVIAKINTIDMSIGGSLDCGAYPREIALSPDDATAYVVHRSRHIDVFDTTTCLWTGQIGTGSEEAQELLVDGSGAYLFAAFDDVLQVYDTGAVPPVIPVQIDIKPGADPNYINPRSGGLVPVAVLTTPDFDAALVNPATLQLAAATIATRGRGERPATRLRDIDKDGDLGLLVQFRVRELGLGPATTGLTLVGATYSGEPIEGYDDVVLARRIPK